MPHGSPHELSSCAVMQAPKQSLGPISLFERVVGVAMLDQLMLSHGPRDTVCQLLNHEQDRSQANQPLVSLAHNFVFPPVWLSGLHSPQKYQTHAPPVSDFGKTPPQRGSSHGLAGFNVLTLRLSIWLQ